MIRAEEFKKIQEEKLIKYEELLQKLKETKEEKNLLLGNGFNSSLKVSTKYEYIFNKMIEKYPDYQKLKRKFKEKDEDIEALIGVLTEHIPKDMEEFLLTYINSKVKLDFMKAANTIVQSKIKDIYKNKNDGIYILLSKFDNYFTFNYDPFLYLLLMKFKGQENVYLEKQELYKVIKDARKDGTLTISVNEENSEFRLNVIKKTQFTNDIRMFLKQKGYSEKIKDINEVVNHIWNEEANNQKQQIRNVNDGFVPNDSEKKYIYDYSDNQNIFFIHGAFHIKEKEDTICKITQATEKALYTEIEEAINNEEKIICVFRHDNKIDEITQNEYLRKAYEKLITLKGSLVIIGCSLSENDKHVFEQISRSNVNTVYISSMAYEVKDQEKQKEIINQDYEKAKRYFSRKQVVLVDATSISYEPLKQQRT